MTSPNRDRAEREAIALVGAGRFEPATWEMRDGIADFLVATYDERDRLLAEAEQRIKTLEFELRTERRASNEMAQQLSTALADRDRYKDALADARNETLREAIDYAETCAYDQRSMLTAAVHAVFDGLLTQPDRSAARQKVIETGAALCAAVGNPDPTGDVDPWYQQLWQAVQELQSPNKEEGGK